MSDLDWQTDWLYALIFREAESVWKTFHRFPNHRFLHIGEWSLTDGIHCSGKLINTWIFDEQGLRKIGFTEDFKNWILSFVGRPSYCASLSFHIDADRKHVVIGRRFHIARSYGGGGYGGVFFVEGAGSSAQLKPDSLAGFWMI